ncbi:VOC family protein [Polaribacter cellanae]|uniref:VOC family protein n=1 Tax=Polaribacter cellanae TaxID=2818493 RepID=A0A975CPS5_9FLAO|nr:VOC family protein [Polaribacter cellanae]QTE23110.1 VOC family protein [Polaribacter cellanae]
MKFKPGINHIEFWVSDLEESVKFYNGFLKIIGWKQTNEKSFTNGNIEIYLNEVKKIKKTKSLGIRHLCFQAVKKEQVDLVYEYLSKEQSKIIRKPMFMGYSKEYYTVDFFDPDGQILEVAHTPNMSFE